MKRYATALILILMTLLVGCERQGPAERAGENLDEAAENVSDAIKDATN